VREKENRRLSMRKSVVMFVLAFIPISFAHAQIPTTERDALIALYNATNGAGWTDSTDWLGAVGTECTWYGVTCAGGHVTQLSLGSNWLFGSIPAELGNLSSLFYLDLHGNHLGGNIPPELGSLSSLVYLVLNNNGLSGSIPPELGSLSSLGALYLHTNNLSGSIPPELGNLSSLGALYLHTNQLTGSIPPELGNLSSLQTLSLHNNQLTGNIPPELGNLSSMWAMTLSDNQLSGGIPPELGNLSGLANLNLNSNQLSGSIPPQLGNLSSLTSLYLNANQLSGSIPPELGNLSSVKTVYLFSNRLSGSIPPELGNLSSVSTLYLFSNQLSGSIPPELGNLSSVKNLRLSSNKLSGDIPAELENLSGLYDGGGLDLRWNALHSNNATLIAFLGAKQREGGDWQSTQTIAPANLTVDSMGDHTVWLSWDAVSYQTDPGGYSVFSAPTGTGVWTAGGWTESKTDTSYPVTGLVPGTIYDLAVVTYTDPHADNFNLVHSDFSPEVMATTASGGCAQPIIEKVDPVTLSIMGSYDGYLWSTGATTSSIVVNPLFEQWYWVTVTSAGSCEETAATSVDPARVFSESFESGDTSAWSSTVP
jgi:Leucine-rich repeat (LRR) protein